MLIKHYLHVLYASHDFHFSRDDHHYHRHHHQHSSSSSTFIVIINIHRHHHHYHLQNARITNLMTRAMLPQNLF